MIALARSLAGKAPPALPIPVRAEAAIVSITVSGTCVPAAPSR